MRIKSTIKLVLSILLCTICVLSIMGCISFAESVENQEHIHSYVWTVIKNPTCTENGIIVQKCSCGDTIGDEVKTDTLGHDFIYTPNFIDGTETCLTHTVTCSRCDFKKENVACSDFTWKVTGLNYTDEHYVVCAQCSGEQIGSRKMHKHFQDPKSGNHLCSECLKHDIEAFAFDTTAKYHYFPDYPQQYYSHFYCPVEDCGEELQVESIGEFSRLFTYREYYVVGGSVDIHRTIPSATVTLNYVPYKDESCSNSNVHQFEISCDSFLHGNYERHAKKWDDVKNKTYGQMIDEGMYDGGYYDEDTTYAEFSGIGETFEDPTFIKGEQMEWWDSWDSTFENTGAASPLKGKTNGKSVKFDVNLGSGHYVIYVTGIHSLSRTKSSVSTNIKAYFCEEGYLWCSGPDSPIFTKYNVVYRDAEGKPITNAPNDVLIDVTDQLAYPEVTAKVNISWAEENGYIYVGYTTSLDSPSVDQPIPGEVATFLLKRGITNQYITFIFEPIQ